MSFDNLASERVRPIWINSRPEGGKERAMPPRVRTTINPVKRGMKRVTRNPTGNPRERVAMGSESERALNRRNERTSPLLGLTGLPKKGQDKGPAAVFPTGVHPRTNPAESMTLRPRKTDVRNGVTGAGALPDGWSRPGAGSRPQAARRKDCPRSKCPREIGGYADVGTMVWKVEERVGVDKP